MSFFVLAPVTHLATGGDKSLERTFNRVTAAGIAKGAHLIVAKHKPSGKIVGSVFWCGPGTSIMGE